MAWACMMKSSGTLLLVLLLTVLLSSTAFINVVLPRRLEEEYRYCNNLHHLPCSNDDDFSQSLSDRISQVQQKEDSFVDGLQSRINTVAKADEEFDSAVSGIVDLPVICLDALLPNQTLIGSTTDPTFCNMLRTIGLGGIFVMTSLNNRQRRIRRFGVIARIELVDVDGDDNDDDTTVVEPPEQYKHLSTPTQVSFSIVGKRRCEILGKDGEETRLGWGDEAFVDKRGVEEDNDEVESITSVNTTINSFDNTKWNTNKVLIIDESYEEDDQADAIAKATYLIPLIESWMDLARNQTTYDNVDVIARTRRKSGEPGLSVNAAALIKKVLQEIGPMPSPSQPTLFAIWGAALINPLPALGVSTEIRGAVLEAPGAERKLSILERGLIKSINNLDGTRPLNM